MSDGKDYNKLSVAIDNETAAEFEDIEQEETIQ